MAHFSCRLLAAVVVCHVLITSVHARSDGAPDAACSSMVPSHPGSASTNPGYTVVPSTTSYTVGQTYTLTVSRPSVMFKGILCQARRGTTQIAVFTGPYPAGTKQLTSGLCVDSVTHSNADDKSSVVLNWQASASTGSFNFVCTVVQSYTNYFVMIPSATINPAPVVTTPMTTTPPPTTAGQTTVAPATMAPTTMAPTTMAPTTPAPTTKVAQTTNLVVTSAGCGSTKSCYRRPAACTGSTDCDYFYSQRPVGNNLVEIELVAKSDGWVAVGYSDDKSMGLDDTHGCSVSANGMNVFLKNGNNPGYTNSIDSAIDPDAFFGNRQSSYVNGQLSCKFNRPLTTPSVHDKSFAAGNQYYLFFAVNTLAAARGTQLSGFVKHSVTPVISAKKYSVTDATVANLGPGSSSFISSTGCGTTKSCYRSPATCTGASDCDFFYSQAPVGTLMVEIELAGKSSGWIAAGFSPDTTMGGNDDVLGCGVGIDGTSVYIKNGNNPTKTNVLDDPNDPDRFLTGQQTSFSNGRLACKFQRLLHTTSAVDRDFTRAYLYYIFFASNTLASAQAAFNASFVKHNSLPFITPSPYSIIDTTVSDLSKAVELVSTVGCGTTKSCYRRPSTCTGQNDCDFLYTQQPIGLTRVEIGLAGKTNGWIAVGYSDDRTMGNDDVMGCIVGSSGDTVYVKNAWNAGRSNQLNNATMPTIFLSDMQSSFSNGQVACRFGRRLNTGSPFDKDLSAKNKYYLFFGRNTKTSGRGAAFGSLIGQHDSLPLISTQQYSVTERSISNLGASAETRLVKAHGFFMIVAWIILAGVGLFMPRYMKKAWAVPEDGIAWWFKFHRPLMITVWLCTVIGFILILSHKDWKWSTASAHPALGLTVFLLCGIQPFMAAIRKKLKPFQRKVFNWSHRTVGLAAHFLGGITIYLGMDLFRKSSGLPNAALYLWAAWITIEALIWIGLETKLLVCPPKNPQEKINADASLRKALLAVYALNGLVFGLAMAIMVVANSPSSDD